MINPGTPPRLRGVFGSLLIPALLLPLALPLVITPLEQRINSGLGLLQAPKIKATVELLASRSFRGRGTGTPESELTVAYIASVFQRNGLVPPLRQGSSFVQQFELTQALPRNESFLRIEPEGSISPPLKFRDDYVPAPWGRDSEAASGGMVFVGYGVRAPDMHYDDYAGLSVQDRVVLALSKMPPSGNNGLSNHITRQDHEDPLEKARLAQSLGARGLILILPAAEEIPLARETEVRKAPIYLSQDVHSINIPCMLVSFRTGEMLLQGNTPSPDADLNSIKKEIDQQGSPRSFLMSQKAELQAQYERRDFLGYNVIGEVPGSDPTLREQAVLVSAHHDHLGVGDNQEIFYGADDDASGTAGVLELSEAFGQNPAKPPRSILLAAWGAEEVGLLGSKYYVSNPLFPLKRTIAQIQLDMIGRDEDRPGDPNKGIAEEKPEANLNTVTVNGTPFSHDLRMALETNNEKVGLELRFRYDTGEENLIKRSDHWPFLKAGVPSMLLFTGFHADYHKTTDTPDKIDYAKMERILKLVYRTAWQLADRTKSPDYSDRLFRQD